MEQLMKALQAGDIQAFEGLIDAEPDLANAKNAQGVSILAMCAYYGRQPFVDLLLRKGAQAGFFEALILGKEEPVKQSLGQHAELANTCSPDGFTPLCLAAFFGHKDLAEVLLSAGADINRASVNPMKVRPLHSAVASPNEARVLDLVKFLVEHGADVNLTQESGWRPLHESVSRGHQSVVQYLLDHQADPNATGTDGRRPINMVPKDNPGIGEILKRHGATE